MPRCLRVIGRLEEQGKEVMLSVGEWGLGEWIQRTSATRYKVKTCHDVLVKPILRLLRMKYVRYGRMEEQGEMMIQRALGNTRYEWKCVMMLYWRPHCLRMRYANYGIDWKSGCHMNVGCLWVFEKHRHRGDMRGNESSQCWVQGAQGYFCFSLQHKIQLKDIKKTVYIKLNYNFKDAFVYRRRQNLIKKSLEVCNN